MLILLAIRLVAPKLLALQLPSDLFSGAVEKIPRSSALQNNFELVTFQYGMYHVLVAPYTSILSVPEPSISLI